MSNPRVFEITITLKEGQTVFLAANNKIVSALVEDKRKNKSWTGLISNLSVEKFSWLLRFPSIISRRLFINQQTLELKFCRGLLGSGTGCICINGANDTIPKSTTSNQSIPNNIRNNSKNATRLATEIRDALVEGMIENDKLKELASISPFECENPYAIAVLLIENINDGRCWSSKDYVRERSLLTKLIRKFLHAHHFKEGDIATFTKEKQVQIQQQIDE
jgi:hypothetical protein